MARYAFLNNAGTRVTNVTGPTAADLVQRLGLVECGEEVGIDWQYNSATGVFSPPAPNANKARREIKQAVRQLLRQTDWTQVNDNLNQTKRDLWKTFRQDLRGVTAQAETDPFNVVWPAPPGDLDEDGL